MLSRGQLIPLFLCGLLLLVVCQAKGVVELNNDNINSYFNQKDHSKRWFILFYSPRCGHCRAFKPTWERFAEINKDPTLSVGNVNCDSNPELRRRYKVQYYPTTFLFVNGEMYEYSDKREVQALEAFVNGGYKAKEPIKLTPNGGQSPGQSSMRIELIFGILAIIGIIVLCPLACMYFSMCPKKRRGSFDEEPAALGNELSYTLHQDKNQK